MTRSASATARSIKKADSGVALIAVLVGLMVLSAVAVGLAVSVQTEARTEAADFEAVQAEELAKSGHEFASLLESRGLTRGPDLFAGLPVEAITPELHYRVQLMSGTVDIYFESDNGKIDLSSAPPEVITNFFSLWTGDVAQAQFISAAIEDWRDADNDVRPNGAETPFYAASNYAPRNGPLGIADAPLIRGISLEDFQLKFFSDAQQGRLRESLDAYVAFGGVGNLVNPNFAPELVLRSIPGLTDSAIDSILARRDEHFFTSSEDLQTIVGLRTDTPAWRYLSFSRVAPATRTVAKLKANGIVRSERRVVYSFVSLDMFTGLYDTKSAIGRIERH
jgi:general secretion pathway protein K